MTKRLRLRLLRGLRLLLLVQQALRLLNRLQRALRLRPVVVGAVGRCLTRGIRTFLQPPRRIRQVLPLLSLPFGFALQLFNAVGTLMLLVSGLLSFLPGRLMWHWMFG